MRKRLLSLVLTLAMVVSLCAGMTVTASANGGEPLTLQEIMDISIDVIQNMKITNENVGKVQDDINQAIKAELSSYGDRYNNIPVQVVIDKFSAPTVSATGKMTLTVNVGKFGSDIGFLEKEIKNFIIPVLPDLDREKIDAATAAIMAAIPNMTATKDTLVEEVIAKFNAVLTTENISGVIVGIEQFEVAVQAGYIYGKLIVTCNGKNNSEDLVLFEIAISESTPLLGSIDISLDYSATFGAIGETLPDLSNLVSEGNLSAEVFDTERNNIRVYGLYTGARWVYSPKGEVNFEYAYAGDEVNTDENVYYIELTVVSDNYQVDKEAFEEALEEGTGIYIKNKEGDVYHVISFNFLQLQALETRNTFTAIVMPGFDDPDVPGGDETPHEHSYTYTPNNNGTHDAACGNNTGVCNAPTITGEDCSYNNGACSKCGYTEPVVTTTEVVWVFGATDATPDYTGAATGTLADAFAAANDAANSGKGAIYIKLLADVTSTTEYTLTNSGVAGAVIDLNDKKLTIESVDSAICTRNTNLTLENGSIIINNASFAGIEAGGSATIKLSDIDMQITSSKFGIFGASGGLVMNNTTAKVTAGTKVFAGFDEGGTVTVSGNNVAVKYGVDAESAAEVEGNPLTMNEDYKYLSIEKTGNDSGNLPGIGSTVVDLSVGNSNIITVDGSTVKVNVSDADDEDYLYMTIAIPADAELGSVVTALMGIVGSTIVDATEIELVDTIEAAVAQATAYPALYPATTSPDSVSNFEVEIFGEPGTHEYDIAVFKVHRENVNVRDNYAEGENPYNPESTTTYLYSLYGICAKKVSVTITGETGGDSSVITSVGVTIDYSKIPEIKAGDEIGEFISYDEQNPYNGPLQIDNENVFVAMSGWWMLNETTGVWGHPGEKFEDDKVYGYAFLLAPKAGYAFEEDNNILSESTGKNEKIDLLYDVSYNDISFCFLLGTLEDIENEKEETNDPTPPTPPTPPVSDDNYYYIPPVVDVPVSNDENSVDVKAEVYGNDATINPLNEKQIEQLVGNENASGDVVVDLTDLGQTIDTAGIPKKTLEAIVEAAEDAGNATEHLIIKLSTAELKLDDAAMRAIVDQANGNIIRFNFDDVGTDRLNYKQKEAVKDMDIRKGYEAYITVNGQRVSDFKGGNVEIVVPYAVPAGENVAGFSVWYIDEEGNPEKLKSTYDGKNKWFVVTHFSDYVIAYSEEDAQAGNYRVCPKDETCPIHPFADTNKQEWYHDGVHYCIDNGLMIGLPGDLFVPGGITTRAQLVTLLWRLEGESVADYEMTFEDVADGLWYTEAIRWASFNQVVEGYSDTLFGPDDTITREQMVTLLWRYCKYKGYDVSVGEDTNILSFEDAFDVSSWAKEAMQWACGAGMVEGMQNSNGNMILDPKGDTTRAQLATLMMRFCVEIANK